MSASSENSADNLVYILADVHLMPDRQHPINQQFQAFLSNQASQASQLFILGDLFEFWVGDDLGLAAYQTEISLLKSLTNQGIEIFIGTGNRDFLLGKQFFKATGAKKLSDIELVEIQQIPLILLHGDLLCTDDLQYQKMRKLFNQAWLQWIFLKLPARIRLKIAQQLRGKSGRDSAAKTAEIMDVNQQAVMNLFAKFPAAKIMIHGHTHRPNCHQIQQQTRYVLGDWRPAGEIIKIQHQQISLVNSDQLN